jgi:hypothetical protein
MDCKSIIRRFKSDRRLFFSFAAHSWADAANELPKRQLKGLAQTLNANGFQQPHGGERQSPPVTHREVRN